MPAQEGAPRPGEGVFGEETETDEEGTSATSAAGETGEAACAREESAPILQTRADREGARAGYVVHAEARPHGVGTSSPALPEPSCGAPGWPLRTRVVGFTDLTLDAPAGTTVAVVGPNGAGKTTLLRALLGLTDRARAAVRLGATEVGALPPHRRRIAWVPQDGALFPHLTALGNTAYGPRAQGVRRREAQREARAWLRRLGLGHLADRRPGQLSGGQAQRVAVARALAARPRLLLLDEPLAALDQTTRAHVRHLLRSHLVDFDGVCLLVTHDPVEALSLADRVLVLQDGRPVQDDTPAQVSRAPRVPWVARMLGRNAWPGTSDGESLCLDGGAQLVAAERLAPGSRALAVVAPEAVALYRAVPSGSPRNVWRGTVREVTSVGSRLRVLVAAPHGLDILAEVTPQAAAELGLADGVEVHTAIKATEVQLVAD